MNSSVAITQTRSSIGCLPRHRRTLVALGLRRINHTVLQSNTPSIRGMVRSVVHMVKIEERACV